ncbi:peroxisome assembly protein 12 [Arthroderma uncinatum]|uniref:peroxisome assembly protein 12 n=1 Tax=Arthroderma uncinatum TaxID=74035 RepID=UPI00144A7234|nr:peroxisome assembly protein 12 [Arthroderma uncinatum]KAF3483320.1 peroxisome assembly protein 12 [Arthroderma uncinatum]
MEYMSALQNNFDDFKPSLFELLSEQQLSSLLPPSLRYLLAIATHRHPRYLLRILNSYDELYALVSVLVEGYYLRNFGGSFTENFYSLKRERVLALRDGEAPRAQLGAGGPVRETLKLRDSDIWRNLVIMVGIPYLKRKLDEGYDIHAAPHAALVAGTGGPQYHPSDDMPHNPTIKQRLFGDWDTFLKTYHSHAYRSGWLNGEHERQIDFMNGAGNGAAWEDDDDNQDGGDEKNNRGEKDSKNREGNWENGKGRCPVTGRRVLGGTDGLRRVLV